MEQHKSAPKGDGKEGSSPDIKVKEENGGPSENGDATPSEPRAENGDLFGAPADASTSPTTDDQPPHARSGIDDADEEERAAPKARAFIRQQLGSKLGNKTWTLLTPKPNVDPQGFEDPICDAFWNKVWLACAAHNVSHHVLTSNILLTPSQD